MRFPAHSLSPTRILRHQLLDVCVCIALIHQFLWGGGFQITIHTFICCHYQEHTYKKGNRVGIRSLVHHQAFTMNSLWDKVKARCL